MKKNETFYLAKWLELANDIYADSRELMYKKITDKKLLHTPAYLLHWSIELYLKAFLIQHDRQIPRIHDLNKLFGYCIEINPTLNNLCLKTPEVPYDQAYWINKINPYGGEEGGLRYLNKKRPRWTFQVTIYDFLDDMVEYIKSNVDRNKDIASFL